MLHTFPTFPTFTQYRLPLGMLKAHLRYALHVHRIRTTDESSVHAIWELLAPIAVPVWNSRVACDNQSTWQQLEPNVVADLLLALMTCVAPPLSLQHRSVLCNFLCLWMAKACAQGRSEAAAGRSAEFQIVSGATSPQAELLQALMGWGRVALGQPSEDQIAAMQDQYLSQPVAPSPLSPRSFARLPRCKFDSLSTEQQSANPQCMICLSAFSEKADGDDDKLILLPDCAHALHETCAASWFREKTTCVVCRHDYRDFAGKEDKE